MARRWSDLSPRSRKLLIAAGVAEAALKVAVLVDLRRRPPSEIRGSRRAWTAAMLVNSAGILPILYFVFGRRRHADD
jgi:type II secretory pathway component PulM